MHIRASYNTEKRRHAFPGGDFIPSSRDYASRASGLSLYYGETGPRNYAARAPEIPGHHRTESRAIVCASAEYIRLTRARVIRQQHSTN